MTPEQWRRLSAAQRKELADHLDALHSPSPRGLHPDEQTMLEELLELEKSIGSLRQNVTLRDIRRTLIRIA